MYNQRHNSDVNIAPYLPQYRVLFQDSDGSGSIASTASRSSPLPYDTVRKLPSVPTSASLPAAESRESLVRPRDSSLPSPSKLAVYAAARRRSAESAKDNKRTHHYRIQFQSWHHHHNQLIFLNISLLLSQTIFFIVCIYDIRGCHTSLSMAQNLRQNEI